VKAETSSFLIPHGSKYSAPSSPAELVESDVSGASARVARSGGQIASSVEKIISTHLKERCVAYVTITRGVTKDRTSGEQTEVVE
jgi:hypothetical protein